jgi:hypothetical protein
MHAGAERHPRIHHDAEAAGRGGVIAPLRDQEKTRPHLHGLEQVTRGLHPVAILLDS